MKIFYYFSLFVLYCFLISSLIFFFSYYSIINEKIYKNRFINAIQKSIYFKGGYRNIWQNKKECINFDNRLLYVPKIGTCNFKNLEFDTKLTFDEISRVNQSYSKLQNKQNNAIAVLGDSLAMGWGVNDDETYSAILEKNINKKVFNQGVSSYGTIRQVKKFKISGIDDKIETVIVHYNLNDLDENQRLDINKLYKNESSNLIFETQDMNIKWLLRQWKRSFRVVFNEIKKLLPNNNLGKIKVNLNIHLQKAEDILYKNLNLKNKRVIILFIQEPNMTLINQLKKSSRKNIEYLIIKLDKKNFFIIDDHINKFGHQEVAKKIANIL